jgi:uncharacterized protein
MGKLLDHRELRPGETVSGKGSLITLHPTNTDSFDRRGLLDAIRGEFSLDWEGHHGANHWGRVRHHALAIARARGAHLLVVELFAFLHDSQRRDEWRDPKHGDRGAEYARSLQGRFFELSAKALSHLTHAICHHSGGEVSTDATIQSCWDADRLDLGRVGIKPAAEYLSPEASSRIDFAYGWSKGKTHRVAQSLSH